jgi:hypothetical protein
MIRLLAASERACRRYSKQSTYGGKSALQRGSGRKVGQSGTALKKRHRLKCCHALPIL